MSEKISWPVLVDNDGDVMFFKSADSVGGYLEPIDVRNDEYVAYDRDGRRLELGIEEVKGRSWIWGRSVRERVVATLVEESPRHIDDLCHVLTRYLSRVQPGVQTRGRSFNDLFEMACDAGDIYG